MHAKGWHGVKFKHDINGDWTAKDIKLNEIRCSTNTDDECGKID